MALLNRDFKSSEFSTARKQQRKHWPWILLISGLAGGAALVGPINFAQATRASLSQEPLPDTAERLTMALSVPAMIDRPETVAAFPTESASWMEIKVESGDTLSAIFQRAEIGNKELYKLLDADQAASKLVQRLRPGQVLKFQKQGEQLKALQLALNNTETLTFTRENDNYKANITEVKLESRVKHATGIIESSLYEAGQKSGLPDKTIMELVNVFGWDVDFALDIRSGDNFSLIYEELYKNGEKLEDGAILAAEFSNQGKTYRAVRYTDSNGDSNYYTPEGYSMRKAFIRSPVDFRRISSTFQRERYHPVLGKKRPHRGVDYAASTGTPIKAAGDGKVIFRGTKGGYGNTVIIQHGGKYTTLYAHMSKFRSGVNNGSRVKQGQVIGYVGKSGVATGPHLHYEFRVNGVHTNPLTVKLPNAEPIKEAFKADFLSQSQPLLAQLDVYRQTQLALNQ